MKKIITLLIGACIVLGLFLVTDIGMTKGQIEKEIKARANLNTGWLAEYEISKDMVASICFDKKTREYHADIYVNYPGLSFGYLFKFGGSCPEIEEGVAIYELEKILAVAFVSMNTPKVNRIIVGSGDDAELIVIDRERPFAVVVEKDNRMITLYDENDEIVMPNRIT